MITGYEAAAPTATRPRIARMALYLGQMFPLPAMLVSGASHFLALWLALQALGDLTPVRVTPVSLRGIASVILFLLLMRLYDELKDAETDIALGRAGDPLYRDRVLVTGAVKIEDVQWLRWIVTAALVALNVEPRVTWATLAFWVMFAATWCSFNWFFWPKVSQHLLLAFVTHNPLSLLLGAYVVALFADAFGPERLSTQAVLLLIGLWLPVAAWETSRKIRAPEDETSYQTYSRVLGWQLAALLPAAFAVASALSLAAVARAAGLGPAFPLVVTAAAGLVAARCALFRVAPSRQHANLKPWAMLFVLVANAGLALAVVAGRGVTW
jgi:4-hydroxybenzoate polyprenyltransferase